LCDHEGDFDINALPGYFSQISTVDNLY
jgi:hypothetical protein